MSRNGFKHLVNLLKFDKVECKAVILHSRIVPLFKLFLLCFICTLYLYFGSDVLPVGLYSNKVKANLLAGLHLSF